MSALSDVQSTSARAASLKALIDSSVRRTSGWTMIGSAGLSGSFGAGERAALQALLARRRRRSGRRPPTARGPGRRPPSRASFIITNMALRPRFASPTSQPLRAVVVHDAGRVAVDAHLVLDRAAGDAVALARASRPAPTRNFGTTKSEMPLVPCRRALDAGEHEVDDVLGEVVLAGRDEDLGAGDGIGAVAVRHGLGLEEAEIGAAMRLGEVHGAGPGALDHLRQVESASAPREPCTKSAAIAPCVRPGYMPSAMLRRGREFLHRPR